MPIYFPTRAPLDAPEPPAISPPKQPQTQPESQPQEGLTAESTGTVVLAKTPSATGSPKGNGPTDL